MSKQYSVRDWVKNNKSDNAEVDALLRLNPNWSRKHVRDLLARRRFSAAIKNAKPTR